MSRLQKFRQKVTSRVFKLFLLQKLPLAFLAGVKVKSINDNECVTTMKFRWINQNPFRSMYFAALQMGAELSTGLHLFQYVATGHKMSMLLTTNSATYFKKAVGRIDFHCPVDQDMKLFVENLSNKPDGDVVVLKVDAFNESREKVAEFSFTWSCRKKQGLDKSRP